MSDQEAIAVLMSCQERLLKSLKAVVATTKFNYRSFGIEIEDYVRKILVEVFRAAGFIKHETDYKVAKDKNEFPDFTLITKPNLAVEIKSGNRYKLDKGKWSPCNNSENDMGTIKEWPKKLKKFGGENIYYILIEYAFTDDLQDIVDVKIGPFYEFLDLNADGFLRYREKDGNLRPKDFDELPPVKTLGQFEKLLPETVIYRSKRIIKKHIQNIPREEQNEFLDSLKISGKNRRLF
jgi:hypothetical protein